MSEEEQIKYIVEILELAKGEIENNNVKIVAMKERYHTYKRKVKELGWNE